MTHGLIAVGVSLGGLDAVGTVLAALPDGFPVPVVIVQHRVQDGSDDLAEFLGALCRLPVAEVEDKQLIEGGHVYLAPADYHLLVDDGGFALSTDGPVNGARPSIDVLFASAASAYAERVVGVVLTGATDDGAMGAAAIKAKGGLLIVEDPASAESPTMPSAALSAVTADRVLPVDEIGPYLAGLACPGRRGRSSHVPER